MVHCSSTRNRHIEPVTYRAASIVDNVALDGDTEQLPLSVLDVVAEVDVGRSVYHVHLHKHIELVAARYKMEERGGMNSLFVHFKQNTVFRM